MTMIEQAHLTRTPRRVYEITPAGVTHLNRQVSSFERMLDGIRLVLSPVKP
jgi:PadR family transcriptional regulator PadR